MFRWLVVIGFVLVGVAASLADTTRTQSISLKKGWNAVFLEVDPADTSLEGNFSGTPVEIAASYYASTSKAQFVSDPSADLFKETGWGVWYAEDRPDAFLTTLFSIYGNQSYLLYSKADFTWHVVGAVVPPSVKWQSDSFNLVGFSVDALAPPTFAQFFAGSTAHRQQRIYRLTNGSWRRVENPGGEALRSGEAFWVYCEQGSTFQGPLRVETSTRHGLVLSGTSDHIILRNQSDYPVAATVESVVSGEAPVPLSFLISVVGDPANPIQTVAARMPAGAWTQSLPALEPGGSIKVPFELRADDMTRNAQSSLLKISTDMGTEIWIPVVGIREDLQTP